MEEYDHGAANDNAYNYGNSRASWLTDPKGCSNDGVFVLLGGLKVWIIFLCNSQGDHLDPSNSISYINEHDQDLGPHFMYSVWKSQILTEEGWGLLINLGYELPKKLCGR